MWKAVRPSSERAMDQTHIALSMDKTDIQQAVTAVIEQLTLNPFQVDQHTPQELAAYNMGVTFLFACMRSTF